MPRLLISLFLLLAGAAPLAAQPAVVPRNAEADAIFGQALKAFQNGDYPTAYRRFRLVYTQYPLNQATTAALIMGGKALYRQGDYRQAQALFDEFARTYTSSRYVPEARRMLRYIEAARSTPPTKARPTVTLGIAFPLTNRDTPRTQAFFNGLRMAVDAHNDAGDGPRVRMVFRDTGGTPEGARGAVNALRDAAVIVGPLYSEEALAAAGAAETARVPLVAPLATDPRVSRGKTYVFQANPTTEVRGRAMARYALESLRARRFGIVAESGADGVSAQMAEGFHDELQREGGIVAFMTEIPARGGWARLDETLDPDALAQVDALYLPVSGSNAESDIRNALAALDKTGATPRVLGNAEWHRRANTTAASRYTVTYTNDFAPDDADAGVRRFREQYAARTGKSLTNADFAMQRLAFAGYDLGRFLIENLDASGSVGAALRRAPRYHGLALDFDFRDGQVNDALFVFRYRAGQVEQVK